MFFAQDAESLMSAVTGYLNADFYVKNAVINGRIRAKH